MKYQEVQCEGQTWYYLAGEHIVSLQAPSGIRYAVDTETITAKPGVRLTPKLVKKFIKKTTLARSSTG